MDLNGVLDVLWVFATCSAGMSVGTWVGVFVFWGMRANGMDLTTDNVWLAGMYDFYRWVAPRAAFVSGIFFAMYLFVLVTA